MSIETLPATLQDKRALENLMQLYLYDFSEYEDLDVNEQGRFTDEYFDRYWEEPGRYPCKVIVDGKYAGFVLVRDVPDPREQEATHHIAEFFIMKKYRRQHVGLQVARMIFDRFPGRWHVAQVENNLPAQQFWRRVISEYTNGTYREVRMSDWAGPIQLFQSDGYTR